MAYKKSEIWNPCHDCAQIDVPKSVGEYNNARPLCMRRHICIYVICVFVWVCAEYGSHIYACTRRYASLGAIAWLRGQSDSSMGQIFMMPFYICICVCMCVYMHIAYSAICLYVIVSLRCCMFILSVCICQRVLVRWINYKKMYIKNFTKKRYLKNVAWNIAGKKMKNENKILLKMQHHAEMNTQRK